MNFKVGDYVEVVRAPDSWEGSGESEEDRQAFIGHVGRVGEVVAEVDDDFMLYIIFNDYFASEGTAGRNIEGKSLKLVSRPDKPLPASLWENQ